MYLLETATKEIEINDSKEYGVKLIDNYLVFEYEGEFLESHNINDIRTLVKNKKYLGEFLNLDFLTDSKKEKFFMELLVRRLEKELSDRNNSFNSIDNSTENNNSKFIVINKYWYDDILLCVINLVIIGINFMIERKAREKELF